MKKPLVSIIIVTFNNAEWLEICLKALRKQRYKETEIIVINNGSKESIVPIIKKYSEVAFLQNKENLGFGRAANRGIRKSRGKYILVYNDDAVCDKDFITKLVAVMDADSKLGAVQGTLLSYESPSIVESVGSYLTPTGILWKETGFVYEEKKLTGGYIFNANLPLIRKKALSEIGLFDEDYFLYFEETDLCWRLWQRGFTIKSVPDAKVWHKAGMTTKRMVHAFIMESTYKNRLNSLIKNLEIKNMLYIIPLHLLFCLMSICSFLILGKLKISSAIAKGLVFNVANLAETLIKRKSVQRLRKVDDATIFHFGMRTMRLSYLFKTGRTYFKEW